MSNFNNNATKLVATNKKMDQANLKARQRIRNCDTINLIQLLELHGLSDCSEAIKVRQIDGESFLNLTEMQIKLWRNNLQLVQMKRLWSVIQLAKQDPQAFYPIQSTIHNSKPKISKNTSYLPMNQINQPHKITTNNPRNVTPNIKPPINTPSASTLFPNDVTDLKTLDFKPIPKNRNKEDETTIEVKEKPLPWAPGSLPRPPQMNFSINSIPSPTVAEEEIYYEDPNFTTYTYEAWFRKIDRKRAKIILENKSNGSFLVRPSSQPHFICIISLIYNGKIYNLPIKTVDGKLIIGEKSNQFSSVVEIVDYYTQNGMPLVYEDREVFVKLCHFT